MIKDFLIINCIGKNDKIGLKFNNNFFIHDFNFKTIEKDQLVTNILNLIKKYKVNFGTDFSILVNSGPGSFSSIRISLAVAKGIKLSKKIKFFGYKDTDLDQFTLANIELLITKNLLQKNLIKPLYIS
jgi:tRNA A37 threonylcarbamoyladenosine modification protein TsaB